MAINEEKLVIEINNETFAKRSHKGDNINSRIYVYLYIRRALNAASQGNFYSTSISLRSSTSADCTI